jgi:hypothetical protein
VKRWSILGLALALLVAFAVPAGAKMIFLGRSQDGELFVIDRVIKKGDDCLVVGTVLWLKNLKKTGYGMVKAIVRAELVCCRAQTYQMMAYRYLDADNKPLFSRNIPASRVRVIKAQPGTVGYNLVKKVCEPGFAK